METLKKKNSHDLQGRGHTRALIPNVRGLHVENSKPKAEVYLPPAIAKQREKLIGTSVFCLLQTTMVQVA